MRYAAAIGISFLSVLDHGSGLYSYYKAEWEWKREHIKKMLFRRREKGMRNGLAGSKDNMGDNGQNTVWTGDREEENGNEPLEVFSMKVMKVANGYADMVLLKIASFAQMAAEKVRELESENILLKSQLESLRKICGGAELPKRCEYCKNFIQYYVCAEGEYMPTYSGHCAAGNRVKSRVRTTEETCKSFVQKKYGKNFI